MAATLSGNQVRLGGASDIRRARRVALATVVLPPLMTMGGIVLLWGRWVTGVDLLLFAGFYAVTVLGVTAGFHRLFTHRSYTCVPALRWCLAIAGCMAAQGPITFWVATHRKHHLASDTPDDPHSPHGNEGGWRAGFRGWLHAHVGWMLSPKPVSMLRYAAELRRDPVVTACDRHYLVWVTLGVLLPGVVGWVVGGDMVSCLRGALWGGMVRLLAVQHVTWSINSLCHLFGDAPFATGDHSRNNLLCALLSFGEGWHNNHHALPSSARHGMSASQPDVIWWFIRLAQALRLASDVRVPTPSQIARAGRVRPDPDPEVGVPAMKPSNP